MKHATIFAILVILLSACRTKQHVITTSDSVRVETRYERIMVHDTAYIEIPLQTAKETVWDSISTLENDYAVSTARLNANGSLYHTLETKPQLKAVQTVKEIVTKDSIVYRDREVQVPTPTERKLSWWERTSITGFPYLCVLLVVAAAWILRKPFLTLIRRFI